MGSKGSLSKTRMWSLLLHKSPVEPAVSAPDTTQWTCTVGRPPGPEGGMTAWWPKRAS